MRKPRKISLTQTNIDSLLLSKPAHYIYVISEDKYACKDYIDKVIKEHYKELSTHILVCVKNEQIQGGPQPYKRFLFCCMLQLAISSSTREELNARRKEFCEKNCPNLKDCKEKSCIFRDPISDKLYEEINLIKKECNIKKPKSTRGDIFWICSDVDNITKDEIEKAMDHAKGFDIKFAISNISLETWFLFHLNPEYNTERNAEEIIQDLEALFKILEDAKGTTNRYVKIKELMDANGKPFKEKRKTLEGLTVHFNKENITAAKCATKTKHSTEGNIPIPSNPGSTMYKLIEDIESLVGE